MAIYHVSNGTAKRMDGAGDGSLYAPVTSIATPENGSTASKAYAVGEMFIRDGKLCTCTTAIGSGGSFAKGTNYSEGSVGEVLSQLNSNISENVVSLSTRVAITSTTDDYIVPHDGYIDVEANGDSSYIAVVVSDDLIISAMGKTISGSGIWQGNSLFVRKGMTAKIYNKGGNSVAYFFPLSS